MPRVSKDPDEPKEVWIVESGDYEQRGIDLVADSIEAAIEAVKAIYAKAYKVRWESPTRDPGFTADFDRWHLIGHFEQVAGYSTEHTACFDITRYELHTLEVPAHA